MEWRVDIAFLLSVAKVYNFIHTHAFVKFSICNTYFNITQHAYCMIFPFILLNCVSYIHSYTIEMEL